MTDRTLIYPGQIPLETDLLSAQTSMMVALGYMWQATMGFATYVEGLTAVPTGPASMNLIISPGVIGTLTVVDATAFSSIPASSDSLMKLGINRQAQLLSFTAPSTVGQSQNFLIQAALDEHDTAPVALPFFNAANPSVAWSGPSNSGVPQNTQRVQRVALQIKGGTPATTGSQTTPPVDAGWVPLYIITIAAGTASLTSGNITLHPSAPYIPVKLPAVSSAIGGPYVHLGGGPSQFGNALNIGWDGGEIRYAVDSADHGRIASQAWVGTTTLPKGVQGGSLTTLSGTITPGSAYNSVLTFTTTVAGMLFARGNVNIAATPGGGGGIQPIGAGFHLVIDGTDVDAPISQLSMSSSFGGPLSAGTHQVQSAYTVPGSGTGWLPVGVNVGYIFVPT